MGNRPNTVCEVCGKAIYKNPNATRKHVTCSKNCLSELNIRLYHDQVTCQYCGKVFHRKKSRNRGRIYCSKECYDMANPPLDRAKIMQLHKEGMYDREIAEKLGCSRCAITVIINKESGLSFNRKSKINNKELRLRISKANKGKRTGSLNSKFKGKGIFTDMARGVFSSIAKMHKLKKDFTCELCGKRGGELHSHHIKPFSVILDEFINLHKNELTPDNFTELLENHKEFTDEANLMLLCSKCHKEIHRRINDKNA